MRTRSPLPLRSGRRRLRAAPALATAALLAALALSGCSGGAAEEAEPAPLSTAANAAATAGASASTDPSGDPSTGPAEQVVTTMTAFHAPSNNIFCYLAPVEGRGPYARCDIEEKDWEVDPPDVGCAGDWGGAAGTRGSVGVGDDEAAVLCATDTLVNTPGEELAYDTSISMGDMTCSVTQKTGMTCKNGSTGRGFSVARAGYELFG